MDLVLPPGLDPHSEVGLGSLFPFSNEDRKQVTGHHQPGTSCSALCSQAPFASASPRAAVLPLTSSPLAKAVKFMFSES